MRNPLSACPPSSRVSPFCHTAEPYGQGNTRLSHIKRRRLIMPLVALVQKNRAHPQLRTLVWCSALHSSSPLLLAFRLRRSECLYKNAQNKQTANKKGTRLSAFLFSNKIYFASFFSALFFTANLVMTFESSTKGITVTPRAIAMKNSSAWIGANSNAVLRPGV